MKLNLSGILAFALLAGSCSNHAPTATVSYTDTAFTQDYSVKYLAAEEVAADFRKIHASRDGNVQVLATDGLKHLSNGHFLYPGKITEDRSYRFMSAKQVVDMTTCRGEYVYLDNHVIFSNAWSGRLYVEHQLVNPTTFVANDSLTFLATDGVRLHLIEDGLVKWKGEVPGGKVIQLLAHPTDYDLFFVLTPNYIFSFSKAASRLERVYEGSEFTSMDVDASHRQLVVGTSDGYFKYGLETGSVSGSINKKLPWTAIDV